MIHQFNTPPQVGASSRLQLANYSLLFLLKFNTLPQVRALNNRHHDCNTTKTNWPFNSEHPTQNQLDIRFTMIIFEIRVSKETLRIIWKIIYDNEIWNTDMSSSKKEEQYNFFERRNIRVQILRMKKDTSFKWNNTSSKQVFRYEYGFSQKRNTSSSPKGDTGSRKRDTRSSQKRDRIWVL